MPHLTLEYTNNLPGFDPKAALSALNRTVIESELFAEGDIKARAQAQDMFLIGASDTGEGFIHVRIAIKAGRAPDSRRGVARSLVDCLEKNFFTDRSVQVTAEVVDLDETYAKKVLTP